MGTAKKLTCPSCGKKWTHYVGFGFKNVYYYCDKCGKKKSVEYGGNNDGVVVDLSSECGSCKCGGTYRMNNKTVICPKCHAPAVVDNDINILWD